MGVNDFRPFCFVVTPEAAKGDRVRIVVEGDDGYRPTDLDRGQTVAELEANVLTYNKRLGVSQKDVTRMVLSSMRGAA